MFYFGTYKTENQAAKAISLLRSMNDDAIVTYRLRGRGPRGPVMITARGYKIWKYQGWLPKDMATSFALYIDIKEKR